MENISTHTCFNNMIPEVCSEHPVATGTLIITALTATALTVASLASTAAGVAHPGPNPRVEEIEE